MLILLIIKKKNTFFQRNVEFESNKNLIVVFYESKISKMSIFVQNLIAT